MFKYEIYDNDVGGNVHEEDNITYLQSLINIVTRDLDYDFEADIELEDDPSVLKKALKKWYTIDVIKSLTNFNFANGFCKWTCTLPGGHRELIVKQM